MLILLPCLIAKIVGYGILLSTIFICCNHSSNKAGKNKQLLSKSKSGDNVGPKKTQAVPQKIVTSPQKPSPSDKLSEPIPKTGEPKHQTKSTDHERSKKKALSMQDKTKPSGDSRKPVNEKKESLSDGDEVVIKEHKVRKMGLLDEEVRKRQQKDLKEIQEMGSEHEMDKNPPLEPIVANKVAIKEDQCKLYETEHEGTLED